MQDIKTYFAECVSTGERHKISKEIFDELKSRRFETTGETHLNIYKNGEAEIEGSFIVKVPSVRLYDRNHDEYILEA